MADDIVLYSAGAIPGVPGDQTPGVYTIDPNARTATFVVPLPDMQGPDPSQIDAPVTPSASDPAPTDAPVPSADSVASTSTATQPSSN